MFANVVTAAILRAPPLRLTRSCTAFIAALRLSSSKAASLLSMQSTSWEPRRNGKRLGIWLFEWDL
jgi:hypothetical protein